MEKAPKMGNPVESWVLSSELDQKALAGGIEKSVFVSEKDGYQATSFKGEVDLEYEGDNYRAVGRPAYEKDGYVVSGYIEYIKI